MNNMESHPRILSLSASSSVAATPMEQSRRPSQTSTHEASYFNAAEEKTSKSLNGSLKKMWKEFKHAAVEHHRSVNQAYQASYGAGTHNAAARMGSVV